MMSVEGCIENHLRVNIDSERQPGGEMMGPDLCALGMHPWIKALHCIAPQTTAVRIFFNLAWLTWLALTVLIWVLH